MLGKTSRLLVLGALSAGLGLLSSPAAALTCNNVSVCSGSCTAVVTITSLGACSGGQEIQVCVQVTCGDTVCDQTCATVCGGSMENTSPVSTCCEGQTITISPASGGWSSHLRNQTCSGLGPTCTSGCP